MNPQAADYVRLVRQLPAYPDSRSSPGAADLAMMRRAMFVEDQISAYAILASPPLDQHPVGLLLSRANALARGYLLGVGLAAIQGAFEDVLRVCAARGEDPGSDQFWENLGSVLLMEGRIPEGLQALARSSRAYSFAGEYEDPRDVGQHIYWLRTAMNSAGFRDSAAQSQLETLARKFDGDDEDGDDDVDEDDVDEDDVDEDDVDEDDVDEDDVDEESTPPAVPQTSEASPSRVRERKAETAAAALPGSSVKDKVIEIVCEQLGQPREKIHEYTRFGADLGADSLDTVELVMEIEDEFDISIPDEVAERIKTVGDVIHYVATHSPDR